VTTVRQPGAFDEAVGERHGRPHVKVCGITRAEDAALAAACGASAIGFVFWDRSPRAVSIEAAVEAAGAAPRGVLRVGVFVNALPHVVRRYVSRVPLDVVQLHGDEPVEWADAFGRPVIKAVNPADRAHEAWLVSPPEAATLLVDAVDRQRRGGTGELADWEAARALARRRPVVLAGGLRPENVGEAVAAVRPYALDVSSGVEASPGVKDPARLRAFFEALAEALR
jgi:phosphoribosylanthranilate isomerase